MAHTRAMHYNEVEVRRQDEFHAAQENRRQRREIERPWASSASPIRCFSSGSSAARYRAANSHGPPGPDGAYHAELEAATGLDPTTPEGNIAGGCYKLGKYLAEYGDVAMVAMAYNMGQAGARAAWEDGIRVLRCPVQGRKFPRADFLYRLGGQQVRPHAGGHVGGWLCGVQVLLRPLGARNSGSGRHWRPRAIFRRRCHCPGNTRTICEPIATCMGAPIPWPWPWQTGKPVDSSTWTP